MSVKIPSYSSNHKTQTTIDFVANTNQVGLFSKDNLEVLWGKEIVYNSFQDLAINNYLFNSSKLIQSTILQPIKQSIFYTVLTPFAHKKILKLSTTKLKQSSDTI